MFLFDESPQTLSARGARELRDRTSTRHVETGLIAAAAGRSGRALARRVRPRDPASPSKRGDAKVVVIDSLNGYLNAMPEERFLTIQLHELLMYLGQQGVATILIGAHQGLIGGPDEHAGGRELSGGRGAFSSATSRPAARCGRRSR